MPFYLMLPEECNEGLRVTVKDVPVAGLKVQASAKGFLVGFPSYCEWLTHVDKTVTQDNPVAVFNDLRHAYIIPWDTWCLRVLNLTDDVMSVRDEKSPITLPSKGCASITMYGYLGCKFRTRITTEPSYPTPGKSFSLKANLIINPDKPATESMEVEFFKLVDKTEESLGKNLTDEDGIAVLSHAEPLEGTYSYFARYTLENTYAEIKTITVTKTPPVCPIFTSTAGTIVFTQLDILRWFRDNKMPRILSKAYYKAVPITGRIASYSAIVRFIIRNIAKVSIWAIEKRYDLRRVTNDRRIEYLG